MSTQRRLLPVIDTRRCTGCGWCVPTCHLHLLTLQTAGWKKSSTLHDAERCTGCSKCARRCPFDAIAMCSSASTSVSRD
jgi:ferredoxin